MEVNVLTAGMRTIKTSKKEFEMSSETENQLVKRLWPNNKPQFVSIREMERDSFALECYDSSDPFGHMMACFVNIFGVHVFHIISTGDPDLVRFKKL